MAGESGKRPSSSSSKRSSSPSKGSSTSTFSLVPLGHHAGKPGIPLTRPAILIGSRSSCRIHLDSSSVSQQHALLVKSDGTFYVHDLASRSHVFVDGKRVTNAELKEGSELKVGSFVLKFSTGGASRKPTRTVEPAQLSSSDHDRPIAIKSRVIMIGRRPGSDVTLTDAAVSTIHAVIFEIDGKRVVRDMGSRTGTWLNGKQVHQEAIKPGDRIKIGPTTFTYQLESQSAGSIDDLIDSALTGDVAGLEPEAAVESIAEAPAPAAKFAEDDLGLDFSSDEPAATPASDSEKRRGWRAVVPEPMEIDLAPIDLAPIDLAPIDLAPIDLAPVDLSPLQPTAEAASEESALDLSAVEIPHSDKPSFDLDEDPLALGDEAPALNFAGVLDPSQSAATTTDSAAEAERRAQEEREEAEQLAAEKAASEEADRVAAEKAAAEETELQRVEAEQVAAEKAAAEEAERQRVEAERVAAEKAAAEETERQRVEAERIAAEKAASEETERQRVEAERVAAEKAAAEETERQRVEAERIAAEKAASEETERQRVEAERVAAEEAAAEEAERQRVEAQRVAAEKAATEEAERQRVEAQRVAAEKAATEEAERQRVEAERVAAENAAAEEAERQRVEAERVSAEKAAAEEAEHQRAEAERVAAEKAATEETERQRLEAERVETERIAAEKAAAEEAERLAAEQAAQPLELASTELGEVIEPSEPSADSTLELELDRELSSISFGGETEDEKPGPFAIKPMALAGDNQAGDEAEPELEDASSEPTDLISDSAFGRDVKDFTGDLTGSIVDVTTSAPSSEQSGEASDESSEAIDFAESTPVAPVVDTIDDSLPDSYKLHPTALPADLLETEPTEPTPSENITSSATNPLDEIDFTANDATPISDDDALDAIGLDPDATEESTEVVGFDAKPLDLTRLAGDPLAESDSTILSGDFSDSETSDELDWEPLEPTPSMPAGESSVDDLIEPTMTEADQPTVLEATHRPVEPMPVDEEPVDEEPVAEAPKARPAVAPTPAVTPEAPPTRAAGLADFWGNEATVLGGVPLPLPAIRSGSPFADKALALPGDVAAEEQIDAVSEMLGDLLNDSPDAASAKKTRRPLRGGRVAKDEAAEQPETPAAPQTGAPRIDEQIPPFGTELNDEGPVRGRRGEMLPTLDSLSRPPVHEVDVFSVSSGGADLIDPLGADLAGNGLQIPDDPLSPQGRPRVLPMTPMDVLGEASKIGKRRPLGGASGRGSAASGRIDLPNAPFFNGGGKIRNGAGTNGNELNKSVPHTADEELGDAGDESLNSVAERLDAVTHPKAKKSFGARHGHSQGASRPNVSYAAAIDPAEILAIRKRRLIKCGALFATGAALAIGGFVACLKLVPVTSYVDVRMHYANLSNPGVSEQTRTNFAAGQKDLLVNDGTRVAARHNLAPEVSGGWLDNPDLYSKLIGGLDWSHPPATSMLPISVTSTEPESDAARLKALAIALYEANRVLRNNADMHRDQLANATDALTSAQRQVDDLNKQIIETRAVQEAYPSPEKMATLNANAAKLEKAWKDAEVAEKSAQADVERLKLPAAIGMGVLPTASATTMPAAGADTSLSQMQMDLEAINKKIADADSARDQKAIQAKADLDKALSQFQQQVSDARELAKDNPELTNYVAAATKLQETMKKLVDSFITTQQKDYEQLTDLQSQVNDQMKTQRDQMWQKDDKLRDLNNELEYAKRQYNTAVGTGQQKEADEAKASIDLLTSSIKAREDLMPDDPVYSSMVDKLQKMIQAQQHDMQDNRKNSDDLLASLQENFASHQPAVDRLPAQQKTLAADLEKRMADINAARAKFGDIASAGPTDDATRKLQDQATQLAASMEARKKQLADQVTSQRQDEIEAKRKADLATREADLPKLQQAVTDSQNAYDGAVAELQSAKNAGEQARAATDRNVELTSQRERVKTQLDVLNGQVATATQAVNESIVPETPGDNSIHISQGKDNRAYYGSGTAALVLLIFGAWILHTIHTANMELPLNALDPTDDATEPFWQASADQTPVNGHDATPVEPFPGAAKAVDADEALEPIDAPIEVATATEPESEEETADSLNV